MSSSELAISARGVSKSFTIAHNDTRHSTLAETALHWLRNPLRRPQKETFWALKGLDFEVKKGDVVGIIGRNGAGKSTLLKILSRITEPTAGEISLYGRVGSLLEVGTGFHPELTGRENIYLNGQILGMRRREITRQFDAIVDFAGVEKFLDTPVKRYSSGMYVRLAFAVAAHLEPEIMVVDEVLAVGDAEFQEKCLGKMKDVAASGRTVLFVSHQMQAVSTLCTSAIFLRSGQVEYQGDVGRAIDLYMNSRPASGAPEEQMHRPGTGELRISRFSTDKQVYLSTDDIAVDFEVVERKASQPRYFVSLMIANRFGIPVLHLDSRLLNMEFDSARTRTIRYSITSPRLAQGEYTVNAYLCSYGGIIDSYERAAEISIAPILPYPARRNDCVGSAMIYPDFAIDEFEEGASDGARAPSLAGRAH